MDKLYENIGEKIKALGKIVFGLGIAIFSLSGLIVFIGLVGSMGFVAFLMGVGIIAVGIITAYISSMFLYGFGELISNSQKMVDNGFSSKPDNSNKEIKNTPVVSETPIFSNNTVTVQPELKDIQKDEEKIDSKPWKCPNCGTANSRLVKKCVSCDTLKPDNPQFIKEGTPSENEWKCPNCGRIHQNYVGTCGCGCMKP